MKNIPIVVKMQLVVNYHDNKEENYWKFKGGDTVVVYNCETVADAVSFANKIFGNNNKGSQRFPVKWLPLNDYLKEYTEQGGFDAWYIDHSLNTISCISPEPITDGYWLKSAYMKKTDFGGDSFYSIDIAHTTIPNYLNKALKEQEAEENVGDNYDGYHQEDIADVDREEPCI
jgi:hypothetical protein